MLDDNTIEVVTDYGNASEYTWLVWALEIGGKN